MNAILNRIGKSRGISKTIFAVFIVGLIGISFFLVKIYSLPYKDIFQNIESPTFSAVTAGTSEFLPPAPEIETMQDALVDLKNLGCLIVNVTDVEGQANGVGFLLEYSEFRKVAFKQKLVFYLYFHEYEYDDIYCYLTTSFDNIIVVWVPERELLVREEPGSEEPSTETYTKFEKVEIQSGVCVKSGATGSEYWNITLKMKNTGTAASTLIGCFINEVEVDGYNYNTAGGADGEAHTTMTDSFTINSGVTAYISIIIDYDNYKSLSSGTTVNIKIHSAGGMDYIKLIELV